MNRMKGIRMIKGFRDFIAQGNVIDLAVAVVIGAAFGAVVTSVVDSLVNPLIGLLFNGDGLKTALAVDVPSLGGGTVTFAFGAIIAAVISFLAIAVVVYFVFVMPMNRWRSHQAARKGATEPAEEPAPTTEQLLAEIRDLLAKQQH